MNRAAIHQYIDEHLDKHIAHIQRWVQHPSVSWDNLGVAECVEVVAESYRKLGCQEVEVIEGRFHPGVWAVYEAGAPVTVHNYCMIDTRTVSHTEKKAWKFDPFGAELTAMGSYPKVLVGRGSMGAKGPYVAWLNALEAIIAVEGTLPFNIMFLAEGEEILGSPTYRQFVERYRERLANVDLSFCPSSTQSANGTVSVGLGLKGMVVLELTASGDGWGHGPKNSVHSSTASLIDSPPFRLAKALASMVDEEGRGCKVKGLEELWHYRKPLGDEEKGLLEKLAAQSAGKNWRDVIPLGGAGNVGEINGGEESIAPLINYLYGPTFNIAGLYSGFLGWETGTIPFITPGKASAILDMRLVVDLSADEIIGCVQAHLNEHGFGDIQVTTFAAFSHAQSSPAEPAVQATLQTIRQWGLQPMVWPIEAGGGPWTAVPNAFNVPCVRGGVIGGGGRSPIDEYMIIEGDGKIAGLADTEKYLVDLIYAVAEAVASEKAATAKRAI